MKVLCIKLYCLLVNKRNLYYTVLYMSVTEHIKLDSLTKYFIVNTHATIVVLVFESYSDCCIRCAVLDISR
jgi:hypothetical protein